jgi:hypothetical protein
VIKNKVSSVDESDIDVIGELKVVFEPISILISSLLPHIS